MSAIMRVMHTVYHDRGSRSLLSFRLAHAFFATPAVANIRTSGLLADRVQIQATEVLLDLGKGGTFWNGGLQV